MTLSLDDVSKPTFWKSIATNGLDQVVLTVVFPTGRHRSNQSGHLALASDGMYIPEIVSTIDSLSRDAGLQGVSVRSILDIDCLAELKHEQDSTRSNCAIAQSNLILLATADVNVAVDSLLVSCESSRTYGVGYAEPYSHCQIIGGRGHIYTERSHPNVGVAALYGNPWYRNGLRIALFSGGIHATGTLSSSRLLLGYLRGEFSGNNRYKSDIPVRIVDAPRRTYPAGELLDAQECIPQHDVRGIVEEELRVLE